ncbi:uncharacterized protein LOC141595725 [Silene latifolia]|uniref:uncharacterized protein LOC141595725 n=1 Tax=Silene latifolia TaxID=37657 RepID=UPI003D776E87
MRHLLFYAIHPTVVSGAVRLTNNEQAVSSARRLLRMLMDLTKASKSPVSEEIPYKKEKIVNLAATVVSQAIGTRKQDWVCPKCNYVNFGRNISCVKCNEHAPWRHVQPKSVDWHCCTCQYLNYARNTQCLNCKEDDPKKKKKSPH